MFCYNIVIHKTIFIVDEEEDILDLLAYTLASVQAM